MLWLTENESDAAREADIGEKPDIGADIGADIGMSELWQDRGREGGGEEQQRRVRVGGSGEKNKNQVLSSRGTHITMNNYELYKELYFFH